MKVWILIQEDCTNPILAIIEGSKEKVLQQLPNSIGIIDKGLYQKSINNAMGRNPPPWTNILCPTCHHFSSEFQGCAINWNCAKDEQSIKEAALKFFNGDTNLVSSYPAKTEEEAKPLADYLAYNQCLLNLKSGFYKLVDSDSVISLTTEE
ncbi:MAG: hypothetical protein DRO67_00330 [Candidatus Asgardarchaeum californiense]|nr:MAG: hypothetical protein DRO67_00330 [Candidatus Asgardarchaeum californiense]